MIILSMHLLPLMNAMLDFICSVDPQGARGKRNTEQIEKVPRSIQGEKSSKDMASSRNLVSTIGAQASLKKGDGTRCPEGYKNEKFLPTVGLEPTTLTFVARGSPESASRV